MNAFPSPAGPPLTATDRAFEHLSRRETVGRIAGAARRRVKRLAVVGFAVLIAAVTGCGIAG